MAEELTPAARAADERRARQQRARGEELTPAAQAAEKRAAVGESSGAPTEEVAPAAHFEEVRSQLWAT